jgi:hypothetical protein
MTIGPANAPSSTPISTGLLEGWAMPRLAIAEISALASSTQSGVWRESRLFMALASHARIDGEGGAQLGHPRAHALFDLRVSF